MGMRRRSKRGEGMKGEKREAGKRMKEKTSLTKGVGGEQKRDTEIVCQKAENDSGGRPQKRMKISKM